ncbi:MAG: diguanylate cyclase [Urechidicola sp.]|jgi:diguanylate cyclase
MTLVNLYTDDYQKASDTIKLVLKFLANYKIPASPINYQVSYDVVSEGNLPLKEALDELLKKQANQLSEENILELYKQFIFMDDKALEGEWQQLWKLIKSIQSSNSNTKVEISDYLDSLNDFSEVLSDSYNPDELAVEVQKIAQETQSVEKSQQKFDGQMSDLIGEIDNLRNELEESRKESLTDALTSLANRRAFDLMLDEIVNEKSSNSPIFSVVIADIDNFKKFNDTYGHLVGDKVLQYVSKIIKACVKGKDLAARFGGEEFTLLLPDTDISGAEIVSEQLRSAIAQTNLVDKSVNEDYGKVTVSFGVAQYKPNEKPQEILERADKALYQAKENGRNRVEKAG